MTCNSAVGIETGQISMTDNKMDHLDVTLSCFQDRNLLLQGSSKRYVMKYMIPIQAYKIVEVYIQSYITWVSFHITWVLVSQFSCSPRNANLTML